MFDSLTVAANSGRFQDLFYQSMPYLGTNKHILAGLLNAAVPAKDGAPWD